jgi:hypothetical protein
MPIGSAAATSEPNARNRIAAREDADQLACAPAGIGEAVEQVPAHLDPQG